MAPAMPTCSANPIESAAAASLLLVRIVQLLAGCKVFAPRLTNRG
jgi:hypothetical protein